MSTPQRGRGRPPIDNPRTETIRFRVTVDERQQLAEAAGGDDKITTFTRDEALAAATRARRRQRQRGRAE